MGAITIRIASDTDHEQITSLSARNPQEGMITFFVNRTPAFNTLQRLMDPGSWHLVAGIDERIIGLVGVLHFNADISGRIYKAGYMLDLRLEKEFRSGLTAFRLVKAAIDQILKSDTDFILASFLRDNQRSLVFTSGRGGLPKPLYLGRNRIFNMLPIWSMKLDKRFEIDRPSEKDIPEIIDLYRKYATGFRLSPVITPERFTSFIHSIAGLSLDHFFVARESGKIRAICAVWDEHVYKAYQVLKLNRSFRVANKMLKFLSGFMKVPHPVNLNEPLRQLWMVLYAHNECPGALETLFRHINNFHRGSEFTLISINAQENDPVFDLLKKFTGVSVNSETYMFARDPSIFEQLSANPLPVWQDITMLL